MYVQAEEFPNYPRLLLKLRKTITLEKEVGLRKAQEWIDDCRSVLKEEYSSKEKMLRVTFDSLLTSRLLDPPESFVKQEEEEEEEEEGSDEEEEGSDGSSDDDDDEGEDAGSDDDEEI
jgi:hypothetical protein